MKISWFWNYRTARWFSFEFLERECLSFQFTLGVPHRHLSIGAYVRLRTPNYQRKS